MSGHNDNAYSHVRSLDRGLQLLAALNKLGRANPAALAHEIGLDRTTCYRLLATLESLGYVTQSRSDNKYVLLPKVRDLSEGLTETDHVSRIAADELFRLTQDVMWPSDFAIFDSGRMIIQETTHRFSPYSVHRSMVGRSRPLVSTAMGRAVLAGSDEKRRREMISMAARMGLLDCSEEVAREKAENMVKDYSERQYAWAVAGADSRISAIALPVGGGSRVYGSVNLIFFTAAMTIDEAADRFLTKLKAAVERISQHLPRDQDRKNEGPS